MKGAVQGTIRKAQWVISIVAAGAFLLGYIIALIGGIWAPNSEALILLLVILGLIVGILNVTSREIIPYLVAAIALVVVGSLGVFAPLNAASDGLGDKLNEIVRMMAIFTAPAAVIQAIRAGVALSRPDRKDAEESK